MKLQVYLLGHLILKGIYVIEEDCLRVCTRW